MSSYFQFHQNNSGGVFEPPAIDIYVEATSLAQARKRLGRVVDLCEDTGRYADYDDCGCCPCCGHRWEDPWHDEPIPGEKVAENVRVDLYWMGGVGSALLKASGELLVGDTPEKREEIKTYLLGGVET